MARHVASDRLTKRRERTAEQTKAFAQLRVLAERHRFRVQADAEGWPIIPGRYGQIEWRNDRELAVYTDRPRVFQKLWAIPSMKRHQPGEREMRAVFPPQALHQVAAVIKARRKRTLSPEGARNLGARTAYRVTSAG